MSLKWNVEPFCTFFKVSVRERMDDGLWHEMMKKSDQRALSLSLYLSENALAPNFRPRQTRSFQFTEG